MLIVIDCLLSSSEIESARRLIASTRWVDGAQTAGVQAAQVKNNQQIADDAPELPALRQLVLEGLQRSALFWTAALPLKILPPQFNRYTDTSNSYGAHTDCAMRSLPETQGQYVRSDISATLFLSDPEEYEGGVLTLEDTFGNHGVKLAAGSLVLYPSSSVHAVTPVTKGERLACFMFIQSMVRDPVQRRLLYNMDMALLKLREEWGENPALVELTGCYHNLLRQWAES